MAIRVFNADDHPILKKGVTDLIAQTEGMTWVGSAANGKDALEKIRALKPDVAVLDIEMPGMTGLEVAQTLIKEKIATRFVLLTLFKNKSYLKMAMKSGVKGYLLKESSENEILDCINFAYQGKAYINAGMTQYLVGSEETADNPIDLFSKQELNILKLIAQHKTSNEIADMLFISPRTVSNHRTNITKKLKLDKRQNGLLKWVLENKSILS